MQKMKNLIRTGLLYVLTTALIGSYPMAVMAEDVPAPAAQSAPSGYVYNPESGHWENSVWYFNTTTGRYERRPVATPSTPAPAVTDTPATTDTSATPTPSSTDAPQSGPNDTTSTSTTTNGTTAATINTNVTIDNKETSTAQTGNANVRDNTTAGNATSGNASGQTTLINTIHSTVQGDNAGVAHFTADINGDVNGDIMLYPAIDEATSGGNNSTTMTNDAVLNSNVTGKINNDITLSATSGDANVTGNTKAGNATTGDAHAVANVINLINTIIAANKSFIGTINIYGNLNGDILISPEFIPQLIASNAPGGDSKNTTTVENSLEANLNNSQSIINNISLAAQSGNASVKNNTSAGNATTGTASTKLNVLNLTGREVTAANSMLVFVNVLGTWVGMIVDAPSGATAAAIGNGVTNDTTIKNNQVVNGTNTTQITNNISLAAQSGNALISGNTTAGNATTGNATASANIVNIDTSAFSLSDWFGVLFINVYGQWVGSFGIDTEAGTMVPIGGMAAPTGTVPTAPAIRFGFAPSSAAKPTLPLGGTTVSDNGSTGITQAMASLASAKTSTPVEKEVAVTQTLPAIGKIDDSALNPVRLAVLIATATGIGIMLIVGVTRRLRGTLAQY